MVTVLGAGIAIGFVIGRKTSSTKSVEESRPGPPGLRGRMLERFQKRLSLDKEQSAKIAEILASTRKEAGSIHENVRPALREIRKRSREAIRALLRPEQAVEYDKLTAEMEERRRRRRERRRGRRGPLGSGSFDHSWKAVDQNGDGKISKDECASANDHPLGRMCGRRFEQFDSDGSGAIDADEMKRAREEMHRRMKSGSGFQGPPKE